jgi:hypothetical protein
MFIRMTKVINRPLTTIDNRDFMTGEYVKPSSFTFLPRKDSVKSFEKDAIPLDKLIDLKTYEEIEEIMIGVAPEETPEVVVPKVNKEPPKAVEKPPVEDNPCPHGFDFGDAVTGEHKECDDCPGKLYVRCERAGQDR